MAKVEDYPGFETFGADIKAAREAKRLYSIASKSLGCALSLEVALDTHAFGYILLTTGQIRDLNPLQTCAAGRTTKKGLPLFATVPLSFYYVILMPLYVFS